MKLSEFVGDVVAFTLLAALFTWSTAVIVKSMSYIVFTLGY